MTSREDIRAWTEAYRQAWEQADADAAAALFTEDASYRSNIYEEPHVGRSGIRAYWAGVTSTQSDVTVRMGEPFVSGTRVAVEFWTTMDAEGNPATLAGCLLLRFDANGLCSDLREYWQFVGETHDPPAGWGS